MAVRVAGQHSSAPTARVLDCNRGLTMTVQVERLQVHSCAISAQYQWHSHSGSAIAGFSAQENDANALGGRIRVYDFKASADDSEEAQVKKIKQALE